MFTAAVGAEPPQWVLRKHRPTQSMHGLTLSIWEKSPNFPHKWHLFLPPSPRVGGDRPHILSSWTGSCHHVSSCQPLGQLTLVADFHILVTILIVVISQFMSWYSQNQILTDTVNVHMKWKSVNQILTVGRQMPWLLYLSLTQGSPHPVRRQQPLKIWVILKLNFWGSSLHQISAQTEHNSQAPALRKDWGLQW